MADLGMRICLFETINETHVRDSLVRALLAEGHDVIALDPVWRGHLPPVERDDLARIRAQVETAIGHRPDALLNFRAATLLPDMVEDIRAAGIVTAVWLPDDPVLYRVCYGAVVDAYDVVLNCGAEDVLEFYEQRHGLRGINFPFWTDGEAFAPASTRLSSRIDDIVFLGNVRGPVRRHRYDLIASMPGKVALFGKVDADPAGIARGFLETDAEVAKALAGARLGFNIPQVFADYTGHRYDFHGLARMGSFQYPSRVIQYASVGLPVVTLGLVQPPDTFPEMLTASDPESVRSLIAAALAEPERLEQLASATAARFQQSFSARARARFLVEIFSAPDRHLSRPVAERAREFAGQVSSKACGTFPLKQLESAAAKPALRAASLRLLVVTGGTFRRDPDWVGLLDSLRQRGHPLRHITSAEQAELADGSLPDRLIGNALGFRADVIVMSGLASDLVKAVTDLAAAQKLPTVILGQTDNDEADLRAWFDPTLVGVESGPGTLALPMAVVPRWADSSLCRSETFDADIAVAGQVGERAAAGVDAELFRRLRSIFSGIGRHWQRSDRPAMLGPDLETGLPIARDGLLHLELPVQGGACLGAANMRILSALARGALPVLPAALARHLGYCGDVQAAVVYDHIDGLPELLRRVLSDVDERERLRCAGRAYLLRKALMTQRADILVDAMSALVTERASIPASRQGWPQVPAIRASVPELRILISGYYGHGNLGDELILLALTGAIAAQRPEASFVVATTSPALVRKMFGFEAVHLGDVAGCTAIAEGCDVAIIGGGGLWHDYNFAEAGGLRAIYDGSARSIGGYARPALMVAAAGGSFHAFGLGVGPLSDDGAKMALRYIAGQASSITVRDVGSERLLSSIAGWKAPVETAADPVFGVDLSSIARGVVQGEGGLPKLVLNLRPWADATMPALTDRLAKELAIALRRHPHRIVGLPMQLGRGKDIAALEAFFAQLPSDAPKSILDWGGNIPMALAELASADAVLGMRLHTCLLAHRLGRPVMGLSYDPKVQAHFDRVGRSEDCIDLSEKRAVLAAGFERLLSGKMGPAPELVERISSLETEADKALTRLAASLEPRHAPSKSKRVGVHLKNRHSLHLQPWIRGVDANEIDVTTGDLRFASRDNPLCLGIAWSMSAQAPGVAASVDLNGALNLAFDLADGESIRLRAGNGRLSRSARRRLRLKVVPGGRYRFALSAEFLTCRPRMSLWIVQCAGGRVIGRDRLRLHNGMNEIAVAVHRQATDISLAIRIAGSGRVRLHPMRVAQILW